MIPDLITPLSKQNKTRQSYVAFLNSLIEEGVAKITTYSTVWNRDAKANLITAVTDEELNDARHSWGKMGFLSRFIVFTYSYGISTMTEILENYSANGLNCEKSEIKLPNLEISIELPKGIADQLNPIATRVGEQFHLYGFRAKTNFRSLLKCLAYRNKRKTVTEKEFQEFLKLADNMNFDYNPV